MPWNLGATAMAITLQRRAVWRVLFAKVPMAATMMMITLTKSSHDDDYADEEHAS